MSEPLSILGKVSAGLREFYVAPYLEYSAFDFPVDVGQRVAFAEYRRSRALGALELGYTPDASWRLSGALEKGRDQLRLRVGDSTALPNVGSNLGGIVLRLTRDSLDDSGFPTRGTRLDLSEELLSPVLGADDHADITRVRWDTALSRGPNRWLFGASLNSAGGDGSLIAAYSPLGGLANHNRCGSCAASRRLRSSRW